MRKITHDHLRRAVEALREIVALEERDGDFESPSYWAAIGECADIARRGLGEQPAEPALAPVIPEDLDAYSDGETMTPSRADHARTK